MIEARDRSLLSVFRRQLSHRREDGERQRRKLRLESVREVLRREGRHQQDDARGVRQQPAQLLRDGTGGCVHRRHRRHWSGERLQTRVREAESLKEAFQTLREQWIL